MTSSRLADRTALVTGSTSNIGRAIAVALAAEGAHVVVSGRDRTRGDAVVARIRAAGGRADFLAADLDGTPERSRHLATAATDALGGRIDILVNNAGIYPAATTAGADGEVFDRIFAVNVKAPFFLVQAVVPAMVERGSGVIVNLGSWVARLGIAAGPVYASTKGAVETLTRSWAAEFGPQGVRVNAVSPGVIADPELYATGEHPAEAMMHGTAAGTAGHPDDVAAAVVFLASDDASFVHGITLDVDGGRVPVAVLAAAR